MKAQTFIADPYGNLNQVEEMPMLLDQLIGLKFFNQKKKGEKLSIGHIGYSRSVKEKSVYDKSLDFGGMCLVPEIKDLYLKVSTNGEGNLLIDKYTFKNIKKMGKKSQKKATKSSLMHTGAQITIDLKKWKNPDFENFTDKQKEWSEIQKSSFQGSYLFGKYLIVVFHYSIHILNLFEFED